MNEPSPRTDKQLNKPNLEQGPSPSLEAEGRMDRRQLDSRPTHKRAIRRQIPSQPSSLSKKIIIWLLALALLYTALGFLLVPLLLTNAAPQWLERQIDRPVTLASASFNPFTLQLSLKNGIIGADKNSATDAVDPFFSFGQIDLDFSLTGLASNKSFWHRLQGNTIFLHLVRSEQGTLNLSTVLKKLGPAPFTSVARRLQLQEIRHSELQLFNSRIFFTDHSQNKTHKVEQINLFYSGLQQNAHLLPRFSATINGSPLEVGGQAGGAKQKTSRLQLNLQDIDLPVYAHYIPGSPLSFIDKGRADLNLTLTFSGGGEQGLLISGSGTAREVWLKGKENKISQALFTFNHDPQAQQLTIEKLSLLQPSLQFAHNSDGSWNLPGSDQAHRRLQIPRTIQFGDVKVHNGKITFIDRLVTGGFAVTFNQLQLSLTGATATDREYALNCITSRQTRITSQGRVTSLDGDQHVNGLLVINNLPLAALNSYFSNSNDIAVKAGIISKLEGKCHLVLQQDFKRQLTIDQLNTSLANLQLTKEGKEFLKVANLHCQNGQSRPATAINLGQAVLQSGELFITPHILGLLQASKAENLPFQLDSLQIRNSSLNLRDFPIQQSGSYGIVVNKASFQAKKPHQTLSASLSLPGQTDLEFKGPFSLQPLTGELTATFSNLAVHSLPAAEVEQFIGLQLEQGRLQGQGIFSLAEKTFRGAVSAQHISGHTSLGTVSFHAQTLTSPETFFRLSPLTIKSPELRWQGGTLRLKRQTTLARQTSSSFFSKQRSGHIHIGKIAAFLEQASFIDHNLSPAFELNFEKIKANIGQLVSDGTTPFNIRAEALTASGGQVALEGSHQPSSSQAQGRWQLQYDKIPLSQLNPYLEPIIGQPFSAGRLNGQHLLQLSGTQLHAQNNFTLSEAQIDHQQGNLATSLALLRSQQGLIKLSLPVQGNIDQKAFSFHGALGKSLRSQLLQSQVSPFTLLAELSSNGQLIEDSLHFNAGSAVLEPEPAPLAELATILRNRPWLILQLHGFSSGGADRQALRQQKKKKLEQQLLQNSGQQGTLLSSHYGKEEIQPPMPAAPLYEALVMINRKELLELAQQRCQAVEKILLEKYSIPARQLATEQQGTIISAQSSGKSGQRVDFSFSALPYTARPQENN